MSAESEPSFKLRRSDIIAICGALLIFAGQIVSYTIMSEKVNVCAGWQKENQKLPACVEANTNWIKHNMDLPDAVLTNQNDLRYVGKEMGKLTKKLDEVNNTLIWFKNNRPIQKKFDRS